MWNVTFVNLLEASVENVKVILFFKVLFVNKNVILDIFLTRIKFASRVMTQIVKIVNLPEMFV